MLFNWSPLEMLSGIAGCTARRSIITSIKELRALSEKQKESNRPKRYIDQILVLSLLRWKRVLPPPSCPDSVRQQEGSRLQRAIPPSPPGESTTFCQFPIMLVEKFLPG